MPELPEVEALLRTLRRQVEGRRIVSVEYLFPRAAGGDPREMAERLEGRRIVRAGRHGKHLLFELDEGWMDVHLGMTGRLLVGSRLKPALRARVVLDDGQTLEFEDVRQFGLLLWRADRPKLGPDALDITAEEFAERLRGRRGRIKALLLNQEFLAGVGNIYCDEALHRARIHPLASRLGRERAMRLHAALVEVLSEAIEAGGSSISDYVDAEGRPGTFQERHRVYGREGEACFECGAAVKRMVVGQRGTHYCPRCQRR